MSSNTVEPSTTTTLSTTTFVNDGAEKEQHTRHSLLDAALAVPKTDDNSIALYLEKPYVISSGSISNSLPANATIGSFRIGDYLLTGLCPRLWYNKISGYKMFRGTACLKLVVNAQPFQAGRLLLHFLPLEKNMTAYSGTYTALHNFNLTTKTVQPCVELDIQNGVATLEMPYVSPTMWLSRDTPYDWGTAYLTVLSPIASVAATTINYTLYLYFKDFECAAPIFGPEMNAPMLKTQRAERKRTKVSGVVSGLLDTADTAVNLITDVVSLGTPSGLLGGAAEIAGLFGWSRPHDTKGTTVVKSNSYHQAFNYNGTNASDVLAMDALNEVAPMTSFAGSEVDEMSFNYLKTIPALIASVYWSESTPVDSLVYNKGLSMPEFTTIANTPSGSGVIATITGPPFAYLSRFFQYYRGSVVLTIKIVKTQYHSGRLQAEYIPSVNNLPGSANQAAWIYRDVIDVSESDTFSFTLPYMHAYPFLSTGWSRANNPTVSFGVFRLRVVTPLVAASTVNGGINLLVYASAGEDFSLTALRPVSTQSFQPEMNTDDARTEGPIGGAPVPIASTVPHMLSTGEVFTSLKQLCQLARPLYGPYNVAEMPDSPCAGYQMSPYTTGICRNVPDPITNTPALKTSLVGGDYLAELSSGFVFSRGGIRVICPQSDADATCTTYLTDRKLLTITNVVGFADPLPGVKTEFISLGTSADMCVPMSVRPMSGGAMDTIVPHYGQGPMRLNFISTVSPDNYVPTDAFTPPHMLNFAIPLTVVPKLVYPNPLRAGADDFALGYFVGFPPWTADFNN